MSKRTRTRKQIKPLPRGNSELVEAKPRPHSIEAAAICAGLVVAVLWLYSPTRHYGFVNYDDDLYVTLNAHVRNGITWEGLKWAFTSVSLYYWQPLTWISHMLDCQLFGLQAGPQHLLNASIHAANACLLFLLFCAMTKRIWPSGFVAALFALHPLRVESVAWIAERKDVLSAFFWLATMLLYVRYAKRDTWVNYVFVLAAFACGLMAKPMLVSLPFVLLLLDYWPLKRLREGERFSTRLIKEKLPLLAMAIVVALLTIRGQSNMGAAADLPLVMRMANAVSAVVTYLGMLLWPHNLAVMYPYRSDLDALWIAFCLVLIGAITAAVFLYRKPYPFLLAGWLWYIVALAPSLGLVQVGPQAFADRFTYLPCIGLLFGLVWLVADLFQKGPQRRWIAIACAVVLLPLVTWRSAAQMPVWRDSITLFTRAADAAPDSAVNQHNLGFALAETGRYEEAVPHYEAALHAEPKLYKADYNLGRALAQEGRLPEAITHFERALNSPMQSEYESDVRNALGIAFAREQNLAGAQREFAKAIQLRPDSSELHANLASCLATQGRLDEAVNEFGKAIALSPNSIQAHRNLAHALLESGKEDAALQEFKTLLRLAPRNEEARRQIAVLSQH